MQFEGEQVTGSVFVPYDLGSDRAVVLDMERLILPGEMGERFKCIGLARGIELSVPGFRMQDQRGRL